MDEKPFMEFNILDIQEALIPELKKLTKASFNLEATLNAASELKYTKGIRRVMSDELNSPSEEFVRFFTSRVYTGRVTQGVREQFTDIVKRALHQFIADRINERIKTALSGEDGSANNDSRNIPDTIEIAEKTVDVEGETGVVTTEEELEGFYIVKSIVREVVDPNRVVYRDTLSYFGILLDDNNRKPICRLHFNRAQRYIGLFDSQKNEERLPIDDLNDIYKHSDRIRGTLQYYIAGNGVDVKQAEVEATVPLE
jgi:predicted type IV restriction endonuclease